MTVMRFVRSAVCAVVGMAASRLVAPSVCGIKARAWYEGEPETQRGLAEDLVDFEQKDDRHRIGARPRDRFAGEWALVTHQMTALGLAQLCLARFEWRARYAPFVTKAAVKSFLPEMRVFGTEAWSGEEAMESLDGPHGHAYLAYSALALGMARLVDTSFPADIAAAHDALVAAYERRLLASPKGLIETYPGEAYPTDVAAVAAAIAVHSRATGTDHRRVLGYWAERVRNVQIDERSGFVIQRMGATTGKPHDAPRGSGTGLAAYYAGFVDRELAEFLSDGLFRHESTFWGFDAIREYPDGYEGTGDIDSGPVIFGVSVAATGFALASARAHGRRDSFERIFRTTALFGLPASFGDKRRFCIGGPFGNALLLAFLTSGPELAPITDRGEGPSREVR